MKPDSTILAVIREMALYWSLSYQHELKTVHHFKIIIKDLSKRGLSTITPDDLLRLFHLMRSRSTGTDESVKRQFQYVTRVFAYAHAKGYIKQNPCELIKLPKGKRGKINSLSPADLQKIEDAVMPDALLEKVKGFFLFQCYTGMGYRDLQEFKKESVVLIKGKLYVQGQRIKTGVEYFLPFTLRALELAEKYRYNFTFCIHFHNRKLKELQKLVGIDNILSTHVGRRTFGQTMIDAGVPVEVVSKMLGHSSTAMTERYYARAGMLRVMNEVGHLAA